MHITPCFIPPKNSRTSLYRWLKGLCNTSTYDRENSKQSCNTNFRTPCSFEQSIRKKILYLYFYRDIAESFLHKDRWEVGYRGEDGHESDAALNPEGERDTTRKIVHMSIGQLPCCFSSKFGTISQNSLKKCFLCSLFLGIKPVMAAAARDGSSARIGGDASGDEAKTHYLWLRYELLQKIHLTSSSFTLEYTSYLSAFVFLQGQFRHGAIDTYQHWKTSQVTTDNNKLKSELSSPDRGVVSRGHNRKIL